MRNVVLACLLATAAATPSRAQSADERRQVARETKAERAEAREARSERRERTEPRGEGRQPRLAPMDTGRPSRPVIDRDSDRGFSSVVRDRPRPGTAEASERPRDRLRRRSSGSGDSVADWRREEREQSRAARSGSLAEQIRDRLGVRPPPEARPDRPAPPPRTVPSRGDRPRWGTGWHRDHRYNWRDHRRRHRALFRVGFYFDPFGWSYRRYDRGWRLWPSYYDRSYWLSDPYMYRLPHAPHPYRWVRYWNDALLVDTYTGQVVDVVHDFFW